MWRGELLGCEETGDLPTSVGRRGPHAHAHGLQNLCREGGKRGRPIPLLAGRRAEQSGKKTLTRGGVLANGGVNCEITDMPGIAPSAIMKSFRRNRGRRIRERRRKNIVPASVPRGLPSDPHSATVRRAILQMRRTRARAVQTIRQMSQSRRPRRIGRSARDHQRSGG